MVRCLPLNGECVEITQNPEQMTQFNPPLRNRLDARPNLIVTANLTALGAFFNPNATDMYGSDVLYVYPILTRDVANILISTSPTAMVSGLSTIALVEPKIWQRIRPSWAAPLGLFEVRMIWILPKRLQLFIVEFPVARHFHVPRYLTRFSESCCTL